MSPTYKSRFMRELAAQQRFAPRDRRLEQIQRAESLILEVEPQKQYPSAFICFRVTGYRPPEAQAELVAGQELQHDLRRFVEDVSASVAVTAAEAGEPVFSISDVQARFRVSAKTIARWRDQGLTSRKFLMGGRSRVGFLQSAVERFAAAATERVERAGRFHQLSDHERDAIVRRARRMTRFCDSPPTEIIHRIARKFGRSPETVRYTLRNHDRENSAHAIFTSTSGPLCEADKVALFRAHRRGASIDSLADRYRRTRGSVYRVVNEMRARRLQEEKIDFMFHACFDEPNAESVICGPEPDSGGVQPPSTTPKGLPPYLASLYDVPLLDKDQEVYLFRKMNFLKYRAAHLLKSVAPQHARSSDIERIEDLLEQALVCKNRIIRANLRLVVSIAKRHVGDADNFFELISDGNMSLIRAVEKFDFGRGNKFSTYASWAIIKNFARSIPGEHAHHDRFVTGHDAMFESTTDERSNEQQQELNLKQMRGTIASILDRLDERERRVIVARFGLEADEPHTLEAIGHQLGVTKERIRQLETRALSKLRRFAAEAGIELPSEP